jgi:hypothetical protein
MSKKGITEHGGFTLIYAVLAVIGILVVVSVIMRFFPVGGEERTVYVSLESLQQTVMGLVVSSDIFATHSQPLVLPREKFILVAFNAQDKVVKSVCNDEQVQRPVSCLNDNSCICLYKDTYGDDFGKEDNPPVECKLFPSDVVFIAPLSNLEQESGRDPGWNLGAQDGTASIEEVNQDKPFQKYGDRINYENLLLYGSCKVKYTETGIYGPRTKLPGIGFWDEQPVYVEKFYADGKNYVFIARESEITRQRESLLRRQVLGAV